MLATEMNDYENKVHFYIELNRLLETRAAT